MKREFLLAGAVTALVISTANAAAPKKEAPRPESFDALLRCRSVTDSTARLACFDGAVAALETAANRNDLVVVDRQQVQKTKRTLFGLSLPSLDLFGGDDDEEPVKSVEGVIASARQDGTGKWGVRLQEGAFWQQIDDRPLGLSPKPGQKVVINRTPIGSYMMRVAGQPGIRVRRQN